VVILFAPVPSARMTQMAADSSVEQLVRVNAIIAPSGENTGHESENPLTGHDDWSVRRVWLPPVALITQISLVKVPLRLKTIFEPSGDQFGKLSSAELLLRFVGVPEPSALSA
jgi:hypothetical protein